MPYGDEGAFCQGVGSLHNSTMISPPDPDDEAQRLSSLRRLLILNTPPEQRFDSLTEYAAYVFRVPIALVSLVDENRQWFKSRCGLGATETARDISFCGHAILQDDVFVIPDTFADSRFADNPLVTGEPFIRFYAGMPLRLRDGHKVGTFCVIDREPRGLDDWELQHLRDLAGVASRELEGLMATEEFFRTKAMRPPLARRP